MAATAEAASGSEVRGPGGDEVAWFTGIIDEKHRLANANDSLRAQLAKHTTIVAEAARLRTERDTAIETRAQETGELKRRLAEVEDRDAKRRKLIVQQQYASALLCAIAEPKDLVLVRWPAGMVSVAKVISAPAKAAPSLLHVECCITSDGERIRGPVFPGAVEVVNKHNFERLLGEVPSQLISHRRPAAAATSHHCHHPLPPPFTAVHHRPHPPLPSTLPSTHDTATPGARARQLAEARHFGQQHRRGSRSSFGARSR